MRRLSFDQYEFETASSEESLALAISSSQQHPVIKVFLAECGASVATPSPPPPRWDRWSEVAEYTHRFAGLHLPPIHACRVLVLRDDWNDLELVVEVESQLVWYHWWTTA
jgi:hypothetical protein